MVVACGVMAYGGCNEVAGYKLRSLVDQLVEGMLPVRSRLAPDDGSRLVVHFTAVPVSALPLLSMFPC